MTTIIMTVMGSQCFLIFKCITSIVSFFKIDWLIFNIIMETFMVHLIHIILWDFTVFRLYWCKMELMFLPFQSSWTTIPFGFWIGNRLMLYFLGYKKWVYCYIFSTFWMTELWPIITSAPAFDNACAYSLWRSVTFLSLGIPQSTLTTT